MPLRLPFFLLAKVKESNVSYVCFPPTPQVPPSIKDHSGTALAVVNVRVGMPVTLECESNAVPPPVITWYKNGHMITESSNVKIIVGGQMLHIKTAEV